MCVSIFTTIMRKAKITSENNNSGNSNVNNGNNKNRNKLITITTTTNLFSLLATQRTLKCEV